MASPHWMSIVDVSKKLRVSYERARTTILPLRGSNTIRWRQEPRDKRKIQIWSEDLDKVMEAMGLSAGDIEAEAEAKDETDGVK